MHCQDNDMNEHLKPEKVIPFIRSEFPCFDNIADMDEGIYSALGDFAIYLRNGISNKTLTDSDLRKAFKVLNKMGRAEDLEVKNLLVVGIFEILTDNDEVTEVVKCSLEGESGELFERVLAGWNNS